MSKTTHNREVRGELSGDELNAVMGGVVLGGIEGESHDGRHKNEIDVQSCGTPQVWVGCAWVPQWW